jgi:hypothetical protein
VGYPEEADSFIRCLYILSAIPAVGCAGPHQYPVARGNEAASREFDRQIKVGG